MCSVTLTSEWKVSFRENERIFEKFTLNLFDLCVNV